jgi:hypothetical protein
MEVLQLSVSKRRRNSNSSSSRSAKLHSRSVDNSRRSPGKLHLSSNCDMRISNKQNSNLSSSSSRRTDNLSLSSWCNMYNSLCNRRRSPCNLHCRKGTKPGNLCLNMRFLTVLLGHNRNYQNTSLHLCCQKQLRGCWTKLCQVACLRHGTL